MKVGTKAQKQKAHEKLVAHRHTSGGKRVADRIERKAERQVRRSAKQEITQVVTEEE
jgi:hypothetical protein